MACLRLSFLVSTLCALLVAVSAFPDSGGKVPLPGPGLSYGGIPYGSVSGNVAEYFEHHSPSSGRSLDYLTKSRGNGVDFAAIEQYL
ncbi:unnamed protein product [Arctia plantaginis]|uniref:Uncharacterized protein n=1 Tax=Arctia plantaginis TaxID=874455 RepID=A0A8S1BPT6_ARCPL|nr:unnamed protein product [Arctia plantaginis]CAB3260827.1 unnamed protein product [Arctia plantaginis]